jgi:RNA polymerase sigma-70 factor (ECF subfamily)
MPSDKAPLLDRASFENLYARTHLVVYRYIYGLYGGPVEEVEDLTAETFLRAWNARRRFSGDDGAALGWLLRIARNLVIDAIRREKVRRVTGGFDEENAEPDPFPALASPEEQAAFREQVRTLRVILLELPAEHREMIVLRYILGWPVKGIAAHLGLLENTVSVILRRVFQRIRDRWPSD